MIHDSGEPGALEGLTIKQQEELRKQVKQGAQVIREVVVIEQEGPVAPEVVTSHREKVTHKLRVALEADTNSNFELTFEKLLAPVHKMNCYINCNVQSIPTINSFLIRSL